jgi:hypothetical protein
MRVFNNFVISPYKYAWTPWMAVLTYDICTHKHNSHNKGLVERLTRGMPHSWVSGTAAAMVGFAGGCPATVGFAGGCPKTESGTREVVRNGVDLGRLGAVLIMEGAMVGGACGGGLSAIVEGAGGCVCTGACPIGVANAGGIKPGSAAINAESPE